MKRNALLRNFVKSWAANSELYGGTAAKVCSFLPKGPVILARAERHSLTGRSIPVLSGGKDLGLEREDLRLGSLISARDGATLPPAAALCHHVDSLHRKYSTAAALRADMGGIVQIELAQTGEGIADCELLKWFVEEGDVVDEFQPLCEVQSDKASVEITSRYKGKVTKVYFIPGDIVKVGETLLELLIERHSSHPTDSLLEEKDQKDTSSNEDLAGKPIEATPAVRHLAKSYGITLADVPGSGNNGRILKEDILKFVISKEELNEEIQMIEMDQRPEDKLQSESSAYESEAGDEASQANTVFSKEEWVTDVSVAEKPAIDVLGGDQIIPIRGFRRIMAKTMTAAAVVPHFHYTEDIKVNALVELKDSLKNMTLEQGVKLTYLPFLMKALSLALKEYPLMNSTVNEDVSEFTLRGCHNIGVGIATSSGLVVPNVKNIQNLSVLEIAKELSRLTELSGMNKLSNEDLTGGTITVSNFGALGGKYGSPVLNLPEVAIVAIGKIQCLPHFAEDGSVYPASIMGVTWAADHRIVDGATVARFCNKWKSLIEQPGQLILNLR